MLCPSDTYHFSVPCSFYRQIVFFYKTQPFFINILIEIVINYYPEFWSPATKGDGMHHATPLITTIVGGLV
ncbi:hypothetical protein ACUQE8_002694, partial [Salmonella enterica subsp. enterica serovar Kentucky]